MKLDKTISRSLLVAALAFPLSKAAHGVITSDNTPSDHQQVHELILQLVEENPGSSYEDMKTAVEQSAISLGIGEATVAREALSELHSHNQSQRIQTRSASKPQANIPVGTALHRGDVFYTPSKTSGINHGHSGIYSYTNYIVESTPATGVTERPASQVKVASGSVKQHVATSTANRNKAADRARTYVGRGYNYDFAFNRTASGRMNCSQTVWAAYMTATGIDLDSDGGHGVYPSDIRDSKYTVTYKRFK